MSQQNALASRSAAVQPSPLQSAPAGRVLQRRCACGTHTPGGSHVCLPGRDSGRHTRAAEARAAATNAAPPPVGGRPLPTALAERYRPGLGSLVDRVRVHDGAGGDAFAVRERAVAVTSVADVYFAAGALAPHSASGRNLLAHDLAHVRQQHSADGPEIRRHGSAGRGKPAYRARDRARGAQQARPALGRGCARAFRAALRTRLQPCPRAYRPRGRTRPGRPARRPTRWARMWCSAQAAMRRRAKGCWASRARAHPCGAAARDGRAGARAEHRRGRRRIGARGRSGRRCTRKRQRHPPVRSPRAGRPRQRAPAGRDGYAISLGRPRGPAFSSPRRTSPTPAWDRSRCKAAW